MKKLAIVITHPIQYYIPWIVELGKRHTRVKVFFTWEQSQAGKVYDPGFGREIEWDLPLLEGYDFQFVKNISPKPGTHHFWGLVNPSLNSDIEKWSPDALLVLGWSFYSHLRCLTYFSKKIPVLFRGDSVLIHQPPGLRKFFRKRFLTWLYRHVDHVLYVGTNNKSYFLEHGIREEQLHFSPHAIDVARFAQPDMVYRNQAQAWKRRLPIPEHFLTVLSAGKMTEVKNPAFTIELARACESLPVAFVLVGNGPLRASLERSAAQLTNVHFIDFQNQLMMPVVYRMGDVYILPSLSETWGLGVNEAMASGIPVMVSDHVGCAPDLIFENRSGMSFALTDIQKCVVFLKKMIEEENALPELSQAANAVIQFFTFTDIVHSVENVMQEI